MPIQAERRQPAGLWTGCCFGGPWRRPSRREKTEALKDYIAELKEELQDAEERLTGRRKIIHRGRLSWRPGPNQDAFSGGALRGASTL